MQARIPDENSAIDAFLEKFNYLDKSTNKRKGFLLFGCNELTKEIEMIALRLVNRLRQLTSELMGAEAKNNLLVCEFQLALEKVWSARLEKASFNPCYEYLNTHLGVVPIIISDSVEKTAYSKGQFEKNLEQAILAAQPFLSDVLKKASNVTLAEMKHYVPKTVRISDRSYIL